MSDAAKSGDIQENFMENDNKVDIETTCVNLGFVKNEPNEEVLDFEEDGHSKRYTVTLDYKNKFGVTSHQIKFEDDYDNLIGFLDNDIIMENATIKLEAIKEDDASFNNVHCRKCKGFYECYCWNCSTLLRILNKNLAFVNSESQSNIVPTDILEIRETSSRIGVFLLRTLPINILFGPFEGILGIESIVGYSWKVIDNKLMNIKSGNWMKNIVCAASASLKNLDIFQIDGNLYFQTNREIREGEELLIYYNDEELQQLDTSEECLYTPQKLEKLPKIFACTMCCLGFGSNKSLMEHKSKCCRMEYNRSIKDFMLIECHYCKMWLEKWEHEEYHVAYCLEKHHRMWNDYSQEVRQNDTVVEEIGDDFGTKDDKRRYRRDICSRPKDRTDDLQFNTKDYQCFSGANHETQNIIEINNKTNFHNQLNIRFKCDICMKIFRQNVQLMAHIRNKHADDGSAKHYKCLECAYQTNDKSNFQRHVNKHRGINQFQCDTCMAKFTEKGSLKRHIKNKHSDAGSTKYYKCLECFYETNDKRHFQSHLNKHRGIKPFKCDICFIKYTQKDSLQKHLKKNHTYDGSAEHCKYLECAYRTNDKLQTHLNKHRGIKPFTCDICLMKYTTKSNLQMHIKNKHTDDGGAKDYKCSECIYQTNHKHCLQMHLYKHRSIKPFTCDICMMKFTRNDSLMAHIRNKHTDDGCAKDHKCSECSYQTNYKTNLQKHLNKHRSTKPLRCDICMTKFTEKCSLKRHIKNQHTDDGCAKDYKCSECSYQTNDKRNFQGHLNKHKDIKPFQCDICFMKYTHKGSLQMHIRKNHTDDGKAKHYKCLVCSYQTNDKSVLQRHLNKHSGIKPFTCDICLMKFTQNSNFQRHIKNKHTDDGNGKDNKCLECSYQTNNKSHLQRHLNTHRGIKEFKCDICLVKFTQKSSLDTHMRNKHSKNESAKN